MGAVAVQDRWAWVAGPVGVALGLAAHILAGGSSPAIPVLLAFAALCGLAAQLAARWLHDPLWFLVLAGVAQQLLHFGFDAFGGSFPGVGFLDHLHGAARVPDALPGGLAGDSSGGSTGTGAVHAGDLMLYAHAAAAILTLLVAAGVSKLARRRTRPEAPVKSTP
ncbi:hypothetical protein ACIQC5_09050 [Paenarthrobacter sp. NPDC092416]|uniref:hypothetical protein n=1 Tax=Paenarthrobacter sp. NPDC092416 TaxID=3364386 RepID=UPI0038232685